jgi:hypothetical protein
VFVQEIVDHETREELVYLNFHLCCLSILLELVNEAGREQDLELDLPHVSVFLEDML